MKKYDSLTEEEQIEMVQDYGLNIMHISNPSEKVQLEAVKRKIGSIRYIKNPTEKVQKYVLSKDCSMLKHIKNPTEEAQLASVDFFIENYDHTLPIGSSKEDGFFTDYLLNENDISFSKNLTSEKAKEKFTKFINMIKACS